MKTQRKKAPEPTGPQGLHGASTQLESHLHKPLHFHQGWEGCQGHTLSYWSSPQHSPGGLYVLTNQNELCEVCIHTA